MTQRLCSPLLRIPYYDYENINELLEGFRRKLLLK